MHDFSHFRYNRGVGRLCEAIGRCAIGRPAGYRTRRWRYRQEAIRRITIDREMCTDTFTEDKSHEYRSRRYEETAAMDYGVH